MSARENEIKRLLDIANSNFSLFQSVSQDMMDLYENNILRMIFVGSRFAGGISESSVKIMTKKHDMDRRKLSEFIRYLSWCIHFILREESDELIERLKRKKGIEAANKLHEKINFVKGIMEKHPGIEQGFLTYTSAKLNFFEDVEWEAVLKVFQSPSAYLEKPPILPVAKLRLSLRPPEVTPGETFFEFEIAPKDLDFLIKSLQDLRTALANLAKKKLVD